MTLINDNNPNGPFRKIIRIVELDRNPMTDVEPKAQKVMLECGHNLINTYGYNFNAITVGSELRCRTCGRKE